MLTRIKTIPVLLSLLLLISVSPVIHGICQAEVKEWTLLVYLNGNNEDDELVPLVLNQLEQAGTTAHINVVVQWAGLSEGHVRRALVVRDSDPRMFTSPVIDDLTGTDMGHWQSLVEFIRWGVTNYPARHYFIGMKCPAAPWPEGLSVDATTGSSMTFQELGQALDEASRFIGRKIDIFGIDAGLVQMIELACELEDSVEILVASQDTAPAGGWPYERFLNEWTRNPGATRHAVAGMVVGEYIREAHKHGPATLSALELWKLRSFKRTMGELVESMMSADAEQREIILTVAASSRRFKGTNQADLIEFINRLAIGAIKNPTIFQGMPLFLKRLLVVDYTTRNMFVSNGKTPPEHRTNGISVWLPGSGDAYEAHAQEYEYLRFHSGTGWNNLLRHLLDRP